MLVKKIIYEEFTDYKVPHMFIATARCTFKCDRLNGCNVCQNAELAKMPDIIVDIDKVIKKYLSNNLTHAIVFGGLEPFDTFNELILFIDKLRQQYQCNDTVIIYTGYTKMQIKHYLNLLKSYNEIIIKFNPYLLNRNSKYDNILGVTLASDNQYAEKIS